MSATTIDDLIEEQELDTDPYAGFGVPPEGSHCHPKYFDCLNNENFYGPSTIPLEFSSYTVVPDSLLNLLFYSNLDKTQIDILLFLHKNTLGFINQTPEKLTRKTDHLPLNRIAALYGNYDTSKFGVNRTRYMKVTVRYLSHILGISKSTIHRKLKKLQEARIIQMYGYSYGTYLAINYHTIESVFSKKIAFRNMVSHLETLEEQNIVSFKENKINKINHAIENIVDLFPKKHKRKLSDLLKSEKILFNSAFKNNIFLRDPQTPVPT